MRSRTILPWLKVARENGIDALSPKTRPGRGRKLSPIEKEKVKRWVIGGDPRQYGFDFGLWTRQINSGLICERFKVELSVSSVGTLLQRLGLTPQKPLRRAYERDEKVVKKWVKEVYPKIKTYAKQTGVEIFWLDEASIRLDDSHQRTWGEQAKIPVVKLVAQDGQLTQSQLLVGLQLAPSGGFQYTTLYAGGILIIVLIRESLLP
ncbi:hypothetical protein BTJ40_07045 [Microbulbifer sp. A4B17]|uniref:winged helix-turn-helix domain-containing protein n=1 Tax=Microbulbifer sp. A4B17 TaxID=359370 RepID=UPI000D52E21B|nr:winged helix-turn-helix domain-containing protein [Microbulbifer sp. A4B17]AWF80584.1 hypothetical protein BTJ40_07045 [Microbulbifer sp. A4B17]